MEKRTVQKKRKTIHIRDGIRDVLVMKCTTFPLENTQHACPRCCLKKNQNAPRPSEHPPVRGEEMSKRLGGIKGCKYKTSSWHLNGSPYDGNIGSTV